MSATLLKVTAIGNLGNDPEVRDLPSGGVVVQFSIAHNERWTDKNGEKQERTEWVRVKAFGKLAENCAEYLSKGRQVYVEGTLRTDKYTDKEGVDRYATDLVAEEVKFLGVPKDGRDDAPRQQEARGNGNGGGNVSNFRGNGNGGNRSSGSSYSSRSSRNNGSSYSRRDPT